MDKKNPQPSSSLNSYYLNFTVVKVLNISNKAAVAHVRFNLWDESMNKPKECILKIVKIFHNNYKEDYYTEKASRLGTCFPIFYYSFIENNLCFLFIEFCKKFNLRNAIESQSSFKMNKIQLSYAIKSIAKALKIIHDNGFSHRDVKPENIFVTLENKLKLGDFGQSKQSNSDYNSVVRTPFYQSPQLLNEENERVSAKDDVWAFGIVILSLINGSINEEISLKSSSEIEQMIVSLKTDEKVKRILFSCLNKDQNKRPDSTIVYNLCKDYFDSNEQVYLTEQEYSSSVIYDFKDCRNFEQNNSIKIKKINKTRCAVCNNTGNLVIYRRFHRIHSDCLLHYIHNNIYLTSCCVFCGDGHDSNYLKPFNLIYRNCSDFNTQIFGFSGNECHHLVNRLSENSKSCFYQCKKTGNFLCTVCSETERHIHCNGYSEYLTSYHKKFWLKKKDDRKTYLLKYKLVHWQKTKGKFHEFLVMQKFENTEAIILALNLHFCLSCQNSCFAKIDFWYRKNTKKGERILTFVEYFKDGSLFQYINFCFRNKSEDNRYFTQENLESLKEYLSEILRILKGQGICHGQIEMKHIFIKISPDRKHIEYKLGASRFMKTNASDEEIQNDTNSAENIISVIETVYLAKNIN